MAMLVLSYQYAYPFCLDKEIEMTNLIKVAGGVAAALLMAGSAHAVLTDDNNTNTIANIGATGGSPYITLQATLLDPACLYSIIYLPDPATATGKVMYAQAITAFSSGLPIKRLAYDRNTSSNICTAAILML